MREVATLRNLLKERDAEVLRLAAGEGPTPSPSPSPSPSPDPDPDQVLRLAATTAEQCARMLEADLAPLEAGWSSRRPSSLG